MSMLSVGDMARSFQTRRANLNLQQTLSTLSKELTTGQVSDVSKHLRGDTGILGSVTVHLDMLRAFNVTNSETALVASSMQAAMEAIQQSAGDLGKKFASAPAKSSPDTLQIIASEAPHQLDMVISALNTSAGGRFLFSGTRFEAAPLVDAVELISEISSAISGIPTVGAILSTIDDWFSAPASGGGFLDLAYNGSSEAVGPVRIGVNDVVKLDVTAAEEGFRTILKGAALGTLVSQGLLSGDPTAREALIEQASHWLLRGEGEVIAMRANLGASEATIQRAAVESSAETSSLERSINQLIGVDKYEVASALTEAETQMETLYAMTSRLSRLSLVNYL